MLSGAAASRPLLSLPTATALRAIASNPAQTPSSVIRRVELGSLSAENSNLRSRVAKNRRGGSQTQKAMVRPERFELPASWFVARRSIQLSYGRARGANINTPTGKRHSGEGGIDSGLRPSRFGRRVRVVQNRLRRFCRTPFFISRVRIPFAWPPRLRDRNRLELMCRMAEREGFEPSRGF
jgi:hypothetical protein